MVDLCLTEEQLEFQKLAREFASAELAPVAHKIESDKTGLNELYQKIFDLGLINVQIPEEFGGMGLKTWDAAVIAEEMSAACSGIYGAIEFSQIAQLPVILKGTAQQKRELLEPLTKLADKTESNSQSVRFAGWQLDLLSSAFSSFGPTSLQCSKQGEKFVLNSGDGSLRLANAGTASWFLVCAQDKAEPDQQNQSQFKRISLFALPSETAGITYGERLETIGRKAMNIAEAKLTNVTLSSANLIGRYGEGATILMDALAPAVALIGAGAIGVARSALEHAAKYAKERKTFGKAIIEHQSVHFMLADMLKDIEAARLLVYQAAYLGDNLAPSELSTIGAEAIGLEEIGLLASVLNQSLDGAMRGATDAVQIFGGYGYSKEYPVEKLMRDAKTYQALESSFETLSRALGQRILLTV